MWTNQLPLCLCMWIHTDRKSHNARHYTNTISIYMYCILHTVYFVYVVYNHILCIHYSPVYTTQSGFIVIQIVSRLSSVYTVYKI